MMPYAPLMKRNGRRFEGRAMQTYNVFWGGDEELGAAGYVAEVFFNGLLEERREGFTSYEAAEFWASEYVVVL